MIFVKSEFYLSFIICLLLNSCERNLPGFDFDSFNETPVEKLAQAVKRENLEQIENLVTVGKVQIDYLDPEFGHSLLMLAVANDLPNSTDKLLELGANPNLRSKLFAEEDSSYIVTPMFIACDHILNQNYCDTDLLESLIKYGGNVNDQIKIRYVGADYSVDRTPLLKASGGKCLKIVKFLVEAGAEINKYDYEKGTGPISEAIIHDRMDILRYLIIDKKALIPKYCFVSQAHNETPKKTYTTTELLLIKNYDKGSTNDKIKIEVLEYLKSNNQF